MMLERIDGERIAYRKLAGRAPGVVWLGGFRSDMEGTKARTVDGWAARKGHACLRFDYYGHGSSTGDFMKGTISRWRDDALAAFDALTEGPQVLVGSSMGGWIAAMVARARPERLAGMILIAPAADFTEGLMWDKMSDDVKETIRRDGVWWHESDNPEERFPITRALIEDGRRNAVLDEPWALRAPVRILQGMADPDVPWEHAVRLMEAIEGDIAMTLVKGGDHRLSTPHDLALLERTLDAMMEDL
ncbi:MAG: alpha/beta hydrolase [Alphaproteobacteria bacterium]|nr:alpha/beta hydrolase [Alphaproteobacteria bacterium]